MYIKHLKIFKQGTQLLRNIEFKSGTNFIVDNTPFTGGQESGNNVGKTTVLRLVDYCLASDGKNIYSDKEFRESSNTEVKRFLSDNEVELELCLVKDINSTGPGDITIRRNFLTYGDAVRTINGEKVTKAEHEKWLNSVLFANNGESPKFRSLISKFIRDDANKMSRTLRYLHQATTDTLYEAVHLVLLGIKPANIDDYSRKAWLINTIKSEQKVMDRLAESHSEQDLIQALKILDRDIGLLESKKGRFKLDGQHEEELKRLNNLRGELARKNFILQRDQLHRLTINNTINKLRGEKKDIDIDALNKIYEAAKALVPDVQKKFEEVVAFHNGMLEKKIAYISRELPELEEQVKEHRKTVSELAKDESVLVQKLNAVLNLDNYNLLIEELINKCELRAKKSSQLEQIQEIKESIENKQSELQEISQSFRKLELQLETKISLFNEYFSDLSRQMYNEEFYLSYDRNKDDIIKMKVTNIQGNVGGGKKKGQIAAFDLAYIAFCKKVQIQAPKFIFHDSPEDMSVNQLTSLIGIANNMDGQYIVSVLRDKFESSPELVSLLEENKVLELSQDDKLFRF